jgi:pyruvate kinase
LLHWDIYPFQIGAASSLDELFVTGAKLAENLVLAKGGVIVMTGVVPIGTAGATNLLKVERIGQSW